MWMLQLLFFFSDSSYLYHPDPFLHWLCRSSMITISTSLPPPLPRVQTSYCSHHLPSILSFLAFWLPLCSNTPLCHTPNSLICLNTSISFDLEGAAAGEKVEVFTTRPDTLMGVTYVVLAPEHPLTSKIATPERREVNKQTNKNSVPWTYCIYCAWRTAFTVLDVLHMLYVIVLYCILLWPSLLKL